MRFNFAQLIAYLVRRRNVKAGSIVGSGIVRHYDASPGYASFAEQRGRELAEHGQVVTGFLRYGDLLRIEAVDGKGRSVFGSIEQQVSQSRS